jgi:hypothetical protein
MLGRVGAIFATCLDTLRDIKTEVWHTSIIGPNRALCPRVKTLPLRDYPRVHVERHKVFERHIVLVSLLVYQSFLCPLPPLSTRLFLKNTRFHH